MKNTPGCHYRAGHESRWRSSRVEDTTNERPASVGIIEKQNLVILVNVISQSFVPCRGPPKLIFIITFYNV